MGETVEVRSRAPEILLLLAAAALLGRSTPPTPAPETCTPRPPAPVVCSSEVAQVEAVLTHSSHRLSPEEIQQVLAGGDGDALKMDNTGVGILLQFGTPYNVFAHLGFRTGDLLVSLNGYRLFTIEDLFDELRKSNKLTFVYLRKGKQLQKVIDLTD